MRKLLFSIVLIAATSVVLAHSGGHGHNNLPEYELKSGELIKGVFIALRDEQVYLEDPHGNLHMESLENFTEADQQLIREKQRLVLTINGLIEQPEPKQKSSSQFYLMVTLSFWIIMIGVGIGLNSRKFWMGSVVTGITLLLFACSDDAPDPITDPSTSAIPANDPSALASLFEQFAGVTTDSDDTWIYIAGNGLPAHNMMVGITNWQQQVPIDQDFTGDNRWQIPLQPQLAAEPLPVEDQFFRNAIGIAVNGIPLYHPMTNAGVDAFASGQLDQWGGHSGRADDYHYHLPPTHLAATIGADQPLAYALDGFPIYGATSETLDENLGRFNSEGGYQYHTIESYPYFIANLVGEVEYTETVDGQNIVYEIIPQPRTTGARPSTDPLGGDLEITAFESTGTNAYELSYSLDGRNFLIEYSWDEANQYTYTFTSPDGNITTEQYQRN